MGKSCKWKELWTMILVRNDMEKSSRDQNSMPTLFLLLDPIPHTSTTITFLCQLIVVKIQLLMVKGRAVVLNDVVFGTNHEDFSFDE